MGSSLEKAVTKVEDLTAFVNRKFAGLVQKFRSMSKDEQSYLLMKIEEFKIEAHGDEELFRRMVIELIEMLEKIKVREPNDPPLAHQMTELKKILDAAREN